jgi:hypothetical protein
MATQTMAQRSTRPQSPTLQTDPLIRKPSLSEIITTGNKLPNRIVLHGTEGWGKTSFAAQIPGALFIQTRGETGLETLIDAGQLPGVPHLPEVTTMPEMLEAINMLTHEEHPYKALIIDVVNGAERLCHEEVCRRDFSNDWTDKGFMGYMRGYEVSLTDWTNFLVRLDALRMTKRMGIMLLCHTKVTTFKNPEGPDYDRYQPDMHPKTWALTHKWSDVVLFGNFETAVAGGSIGEGVKQGRKGKGTGGSYRMLYTERCAAYDAKNRLGLPPEIEMGGSPVEAWANYKAAVAAARKTEEAA